jgi:uncharacterized protein (DUF736 family)
MKKAGVLLSLILIIGFVNAQDVSPKHPCFRVSSFSSSLGFTGAMTSNTNADYYSLQGAVEDPDLFVDITGFKKSSNSWNSNGMQMGPGSISYGGSFNGSLAFNLGLTPYSKKLGKYRENRELRLTVGSNMGVRNSFDYYDNNTFVIDTFQSVNGTGVVYADSSIYNSYNYKVDFTEINFGFSYLFKTDVNRVVHFYTGIGMNYGIALRSTVSVSQYTNRSVYYYNEYNKPNENEAGFYGNMNNNGYSDSYSDTKLKSPMQFVRAYIPIGLSIRLSKKTESFFNHVNLYTELNPGVEIQMISSGKTYANPYIGAGVIGFKYHW